MGGVDFAREDRLKKCDSIIEQYEIILNSAILAKIVTNQKNDEVKNFNKFLIFKILVI
jgi:hypothetical protein